MPIQETGGQPTPETVADAARESGCIPAEPVDAQVGHAAAAAVERLRPQIQSIEAVSPRAAELAESMVKYAFLDGVAWQAKLREEHRDTT